jgi:deoxyribonuclease V
MPIAAFDAHYLADGRASTAAILFNDYGDRIPVTEFHRIHAAAAAYAPGVFYKRELPAILALLDVIDMPLDTLIVDGYVMLGPRPGLGKYLFEALGSRIPVIGVAKSRFKGATAQAVCRGGSRRPVYVTAAGMAAEEAAARIQAMHGVHRIPTLLRQVDRLAREKVG